MASSDDIVRVVLAGYGYPSGTIKETITNTGAEVKVADKYIVKLSNGAGEVFVGAVRQQTWPTTGHVEVRLAAMARAACAFPIGVLVPGTSIRVKIIAPLRSERGTFLLDVNGDRRFITGVHPGRTLSNLKINDSRLLASLLGAYHLMADSAGPPSSAGLQLSSLNNDLVDDANYIKTKCSERILKLSEEKRQLFLPALERLVARAEFKSDVAQERAPRLQKLPKTWTHKDFNFQNVMWLDASSGEAQAGVIDLTDGDYGTRLQDFMYIFSCNNQPPPATKEDYESIFAAYFSSGVSHFKSEEAELLPDVVELFYMRGANYWWDFDAGNFTMWENYAKLLFDARKVIREAARLFVRDP